MLLRPLVLADDAVKPPVDEHAELGLVPPRHARLARGNLLLVNGRGHRLCPWSLRTHSQALRLGRSQCRRARRAKLLQKRPPRAFAPFHRRLLLPLHFYALICLGAPGLDFETWENYTQTGFFVIVYENRAKLPPSQYSRPGNAPAALPPRDAVPRAPPVHQSQ